MRAIKDELESLISLAKRGDREAMGIVFLRFRPYLLQVANEELDPQLKQKAGGSDLVQQTLLEAGQSIGQFDGGSPEALLAWLRQILLNNLANHRRHFQAEKRNIKREVPFTGAGSSVGPIHDLVQSDSLKSDLLHQQEEIALAASAFANLSPDHQQVIRLRSKEGKSFHEIGRLMARSADASRKLWARAVEMLKSEIDKKNER